MEINVTFRHSEPSQVLKSHIEDKIGKLSKYFIKPVMAHITLNVEKSLHIAEVSIAEYGNVFNAKEGSDNMYLSIDRALKKVEGQLKKYKEKIKNHHKQKIRLSA